VGAGVRRQVGRRLGGKAINGARAREAGAAVAALCVRGSVVAVAGHPHLSRLSGRHPTRSDGSAS
jgi:hypothetical protein